MIAGQAHCQKHMTSIQEALKAPKNSPRPNEPSPRECTMPRPVHQVSIVKKRGLLCGWKCVPGKHGMRRYGMVSCKNAPMSLMCGRLWAQG